MVRLLLQASTRHGRRHPWQRLLTVLGVALGVAVVTGVDVANQGAKRAFELSARALQGPASHQILGGPAGVDETLYTELRLGGGFRRSAPVVEAYARVGAETLHLLGIDPFAELDLRPTLLAAAPGTAQRLLGTDRGVLLAESTARRLRLQPQQRFIMRVGGQTHEVLFAGILQAGSATTGVALDGLAVTDIATAQILSATPGRLSWIDIALPDKADGLAAQARLQALLPPEAVLVRADNRQAVLQNLSASFATNLTAMSLLALIIGMFLVYNTMTFAVLQRRPLLGRLRMLGATRAEILRAVLYEALAIGALATALGLVCGVLLGQGLLALVTRTLDDLYFALQVNEFIWTWAPLVKGAALGLAATVLAAWAPAREAGRSSALAVLQSSQMERQVHTLAPRLAGAGLGLAALGAGLLWVPTQQLVVGFAALFLVILGLTLGGPWLVALITHRLALPIARVLGMIPALAAQGIAANLSRSGVAIAALMLAIAATVGTGVMVASFRTSVVQWLDATLRADLYVSTPSLRSSRTPAALDPALIARVRRLPGVAGVASARHVTVESAASLTELTALAYPPGRTPGYQLRERPSIADTMGLWNAFQAGRGVLVSEPYAYRNALGAGDILMLRTDHGPRPFTVLGVFFDYEAGPGRILMDQDLYRRHYDDAALSGLGLFLQPGADLRQVRMAVLQAAEGIQGIAVRSNAELRDLTLAIFDRTFTVTQVLRLLAVVVAVIGILSALLAILLERRRELATLRCLGMTPAQIRTLLATQSGLMGVLAGVLAVPLGLLLAGMLVHVINRRAFGWSMQLMVPEAVALEGLLLALAAALAAAIYPAWRSTHGATAAALRVE